MSLPGLLPLLYDQRGYGAIARRVASGESAAAEAPMDAARPYLLAALHADETQRERARETTQAGVAYQCADERSRLPQAFGEVRNILR